MREVRSSTWTTERYKASYDHISEQGWVYDLELDPGERNPKALRIPPEQPGPAGAALSELLAELVRQDSVADSIPGSDSRSSGEMSADLRKRLEAAGYLSK